MTDDQEPVAADSRDYLLTASEAGRSKSRPQGAALPPEAPGEGPSSLSSFSGRQASLASWPHRPQFCLLLTGPFPSPTSPSACLLQGHVVGLRAQSRMTLARSLPQFPPQRLFLPIGSHSQARWTRLLGPPLRCPRRGTHRCHEPGNELLLAVRLQTWGVKV